MHPLPSPLTPPLSSAPPAPSARLFFLDWLRILAFGLLVPYHVGMYYVSWDWHVKSPAASTLIEPLMMLTAPWRLSLLFFIAGAATHVSLLRDRSPAFLRKRSRHLLWPLLFGMFVVVPPQAYYEVVGKAAYAGSYLQFMQRYVRGDTGFCWADHCLDVPTWNHLWFLPYLWVYGLVAWTFVRHGNGVLEGLVARLGAVGRWQLLLIVPLPLMAARLLVGWFPSTHNLVWDWYNHAQYLTIFVFGLLCASTGPTLWDALRRSRWPALLLAALAWALIASYFRAYETVEPPAALRVAQRLLYGAMQWWAIVAACGFAHRWLNVDSALRRWLTPAIFCVYILHQTVIVLLTRLLVPLQLRPLPEGLLLIASTFVICLAGYVLARRVPILRGALGITNAPARQRPLAVSGGMAA